MSDQEEGIIYFQSELGVIAEHPIIHVRGRVNVGSSAVIGNANTLKFALYSIGCWKLEEGCFDFDKAFLKKDAMIIFSSLRKLHWRLKNRLTNFNTQEIFTHPKLALFGHADPVGLPDYNKKLSEARAKAVYGVLTRNIGIWQSIFDDPNEKNMNERRKSIEYLQDELTKCMLFSSPVDGKWSKDLESAIQRYMNVICPGFQLDEKMDFMGEKGQFAFQGCSEFNPVIMFSKEENNLYKEPLNKAQRDAQNQPNRRVVGFFFDPNIKDKDISWPCGQDIKNCRSVFLNDPKLRLEFQKNNRREHGKTNLIMSGPAYDTFVCGFYDHLAGKSICEKTPAPIEREETWRIELIVYETIDNFMAEWDPDINKKLQAIYGYKHPRLHLDFGMIIEYRFDLEFHIRKLKGSGWLCNGGSVIQAKSSGSQHEHLAFSQFYPYSPEGQHSMVDWAMVDKSAATLNGQGEISKLVNQFVDLRFVADQNEIMNQYSPDPKILVWRQKRFQPPGTELVFDICERTDGISRLRPLRPGQKIDDYLDKSVRHVKIVWPIRWGSHAPEREFISDTGEGIKNPEVFILDTTSNRVISTMKRPDSPITMRKANFLDFLIDHMLPLKNGAKLTFNWISGVEIHSEEFRDEPLSWLVFKYSMRLLSRK